jgi:predicted nucleic acid-binding protein
VHLLAISIKKLHIHPKDTYHLACALTANCDYFITTDKKIA